MTDPDPHDPARFDYEDSQPNEWEREQARTTLAAYGKARDRLEQSASDAVRAFCEEMAALGLLDLYQYRQHQPRTVDELTQGAVEEIEIESRMIARNVCNTDTIAELHRVAGD